MATSDDTTGNTEFDATEHNVRQQQEKELRKNNIKAVFGSGPGRIAAIAVGIVFVVLFAIGFMNLFGKKAPMAEQSGNANGAVLSAPSANSDATVMSENEARLRREASARDAKEAEAGGKTFLAPPILTKEETPAATAGAQSGLVSAQAGPNGNQSAVSAAQAERIQQQATAGQGTPAAGAQAPAQQVAPANWETVRTQQIAPQIYRALGRDDKGEIKDTFVASAYALPDRSMKTQSGATTTQPAGAAGVAIASAANPNSGKVPMIQAGDGYYCETDTKINTDAARSDVLVTCYQGKLMNARLIGKYDASNEASVNGSVSILLTTLSLPGKAMIPVQAIAFDEQTGDSGLADDVDDHTTRKYGGLFLASLAKGFGKAAQIVTGSTTTISTGGMSQTTTVTDPITAGRQAKIALGEVGTTFGDSLQRSSEKIKRTVKVNDRKGVRVVFLSDVFDEKK